MSEGVKNRKLDRYYSVGLQNLEGKEDIMLRNWKTRGTIVLAGIFLLGSSLTVCAEEEVTPPGYHVYDVQEDEVSDTWYGIARGAYLQGGLCKLTHGKTGYAVCSGTTFAHRDSDRVYVRVYLDWSDIGTGGWTTYDTYWTMVETEDSYAYVASGPFKIKRNKYHSARGAHSVTQDGFTEATTTCTDALFFD